MNYDQLFDALLLEFAPDAAPKNTGGRLSGQPGDRPKYPDSSNDHIKDFLDPDTDPDDFVAQGIKNSFEAVQQLFNDKMKDFAETVTPESVQAKSLGEIKESISNVYKFVNKIQVFSNAKIADASQNMYAIMAAFLASDPTKVDAFENLHSKLEEAQDQVQELEANLATLKGQIDEFISEVEEIDAEEAAEDYESQQDELGGDLDDGTGGDASMPQAPKSVGDAGSGRVPSPSESPRIR